MPSENGWEPPHAGADILEWITVPGTDVRLQVMKGPPLQIMRAYAADYNAFVEPLRDADSASFTPTNSVATSNHLNGTAMDLNWDSHPFRVSMAGYSPEMIATMRELLDFYEGTMFWAQDWDTPKDCMHHQMGYGTWNNPHTQDFINRKIRSDGYSTFRRDTAPVPPPPPVLSRADRYALLIIAEGRRLGITPRGIQIALAVGLVETNLTNYANSNDPPSLDIPHDAVGSDHMSSGWAQQQPNWGSLQCRMDITCAATLFFTCDNGPGTRGLTKIRERIIGSDGQKHDGDLYDYNDTSHSPGFYAQKVQGSAFPDRYDQRFGEAVDLYNRLAGTAPPIQGDDELSADAERMIREMYDEYKATRRDPTRSFFGETEAGVETPLGYLWNIDANVWNQQITWGYLLGVKRAEEFVTRVAQAGVAPESWAGKLTDAQGHWLGEFGQQWCQGLIALRTAMQKAFKSAGATVVADAAKPSVVYRDAPVVTAVVATRELTAAYNEIARLREENARLQTQQPVSQPVVDALPATTLNGSSSVGQLIGEAYDALQKLRLADALPIEDRAPLAALIAVLNTKNGSQV